MNKKLVAAAIAAALAAPAAYADATVYGQLKTYVSSTDNGESISNSGSRIGFKGSEDLGNGMKAVFKLEYGLDMADGAAWTSRSQYVGLGGNFGTVMIGKRETNYLLTTAKMDLFADTMADYNRLIGFDESGNLGNGGARPNSAIHYVSPSFSGLSVAGAIYGDAADSDLTGNGYDIALMYKNAGINASVAHAENDVTNADATRVGLGYKMDALYAGVVYEDDNGNDMWAISGSYKMGNNTLKATYGDNDMGGDGWAIGVDHKMSKRTKVYALYADSDNALNGDNNANDGFSFGLQHNF